MISEIVTVWEQKDGSFHVLERHVIGDKTFTPINVYPPGTNLEEALLATRAKIEAVLANVAPELSLDERRRVRYLSESDPLKAEAEAELKQGRPEKYFEYLRVRNAIRRETEPEESRLELVKKDQKAYWKLVCDNMLATRYPETNRDGYMVQLTLAIANGLTNRAQYVSQLFIWGNQLFSMYYDVVARIDAAENVGVALAAEIDFTAWLDADPKITAAGIEAILN